MKSRGRITSSTNIVGIFGDPVRQSISPAMHNAAFRALGLDFIYLPFHVYSKTQSTLKNAIEAIRALDIKGVNITIPHKEEAIKFIDEVSPDAEAAGSVNTIVNRNGRLFGFNTDGEGFLIGIKKEANFSPRGKNIIIIGAGGAARSIIFSLLRKKASSVVVANRTEARAEALARGFRKTLKGARISAMGLDVKEIERLAPRADLVVNTTSIGMMGKGSMDFPMHALEKNAIVADIVYKPVETDFIKKAKRCGLRTHNGLNMLIAQGALTFRLWTGMDAPQDAMLKAALKALKENG